MRLVGDPKIRLRVRPAPDPAGEVAGYVTANNVYAVLESTVNGFYKLANGSGYVMAAVPGASWEVTAEPATITPVQVAESEPASVQKLGQSETKPPAVPESIKSTKSKGFFSSLFGSKKKATEEVRQPVTTLPSERSSTTTAVNSVAFVPSPAQVGTTLAESLQHSQPPTQAKTEQYGSHGKLTVGEVPDVGLVGAELLRTTAQAHVEQPLVVTAGLVVDPGVQKDHQTADTNIGEVVNRKIQPNISEVTLQSTSGSANNQKPVDLTAEECKLAEEIQACRILVRFFQGVVTRRKYSSKKGQVDFARNVYLRIVDTTTDIDVLSRGLAASFKDKNKHEELTIKSLRSLSRQLQATTAAELNSFSPEVLIKCMKAYSRHQEILVGCVEIISDVCKFEGSSSSSSGQAEATVSDLVAAREVLVGKFGDAGGCEVLLALIDRHLKSGSFVYKSFRALFRLCQNSTANHIRVGSSNGCVLIMKALTKYMKSIAVFEVILRTLFVVCDFAGCQTTLGEIGACEILLAALQSMHGAKHEKMICLICKTIIAVSGKGHRENQILFTKSPKFTIFTSIIADYCESVVVLEGASWTILTLCMENFEAAELVSRSGLLESLIVVLDNPNCATQSKLFCLWLLSTVAYEDPEMEAVYNRLRVALTKHESESADPEIKVQARVAKMRLGRPRILTAVEST
jgi:hypothetical protein